MMTSQSNAQKITAANISLEFLKREVKKLTEEQKRTRLMLLEILENTRPYHLTEKPEESESESTESDLKTPTSSASWFWG